MNSKAISLILLIVITVIFITHPRSQAIAQGISICGQCRFIRYENPPGIGWSYYVCTTSDNHLLAISGLPSDGYYLISNAVIDWSPIVLPDKTRIEGRITSWSYYEGVESCKPFQIPTSTPTPIPGSGYAQNMPEIVCGQLSVGSDGLHYYITFMPSTETQSWWIDPIAFPEWWNLDIESLDGSFVRIYNPQFDPDGAATYGYPNQKLLIGFSAIGLAQSCTPTTVCGEWSYGSDVAWGFKPWDSSDFWLVDVVTPPTSDMGSLVGHSVVLYDPTFSLDPSYPLVIATRAKVVNNCSPTPRDTVAPPHVEITNFTLADTLTDFPQFQESVILKPNTLWIQVTNTGQTPFNPLSDGGKYIVQVILKRTGIGKVEEYDYASGQSGLTPLGGLEPGESVVVHISDLFFFTPVDNAELEVFFSPDPSLGMEGSILSKPITIRDHPDTFLRCAGTMAQSIIKVAKVALPQYRAALSSTDLAVRIVKCNFNGGCVAKETAKWLFGLVVGSIQDVGQVLTIGADALWAMSENGPPPCIKLTDWLNAYLHEAIRNKLNVNGVAAESPVYPLVINEAGQQAGFLENGQIVEEIPGSKVVAIGEQKFILYPGNGLSQLSIAGYAEGKMNLYATYTQEPGQGISVRYHEVTITPGMKATLDSSDLHYMLKIDTNGDGSVDQTLPPNEVLTLTESGVSPLQPIGTPTVTAVPTIPPAEKPLPQQPKGICGGVLGLLALPILLILIQHRRS